ncbi:MAG TPA: hypothetical protein PK657_10010 [Legionella sp.]|nr:hypothetical protein [Legionella sp.]
MIINDVNSDYLDLKFRNELIELIHFIRTPLASIKIGSEILKDILPILLNVYKNSSQQVSNNDVVIGGDKLSKLYSVIDNILVEANRISEYMKKIENHGLTQK